jgi:hypothetical protein
MFDLPDARREDGSWRRAHETAHTLRDMLLAIGIPVSELNALTARRDSAGTDRVVIPPLTLADTDRIINALGPSVGPQGAHLARQRPA